MTPRPWLVVRVRPNQDARARQNAEQQGYEWYVPRAFFRSPRTRKMRVESLFPGYAFARHESSFQWNSLRGTFGVAEIMMVTDELPARVADKEMQYWKSREGPDGLVRLHAMEFTRGEKVRVDHGNMSLDAIVDGMAGQDRIYVLLAFLGGARAEVEVKDVTKE